MVIANPIYDVVFKRLMENERVAKFFISTLLGEIIEDIEVKPQEFTYTDELAGVSLFRLDFIATIKTETGEFKKVLIEIQKARNEVDLMRFRKYIGEQYGKENTVVNEKIVLPITTIYILGFKLPGINTSCLKVERNYKDLLENKVIHTKSEFVEKLTHDSFIVQVHRITEKYQTKLDKLLSLFEQRNFVDDKKITKEFKHEPDIDELKEATKILHHTGTDPEERKKLEIEEEALRSIDAMFAKERKAIHKELAESKLALNEKDKVLSERNKALSQKDKALSEKDKEIKELKRRLGEK